MAGSYGHIVNADGSFRGTDLIENLGDACEALEQMYGMIWWLAEADPLAVEWARTHHKEGLAQAPGQRRE